MKIPDPKIVGAKAEAVLRYMETESRTTSELVAFQAGIDVGIEIGRRGLDE